MRTSTRVRVLVVFFTAALGSGCATGGTFADLAQERDRLAELDTTLATRGRFPSEDVISADAQLVTFSYKVGATVEGQSRERRDTLVGPDGVAGWLTQWHARQLPDVDFLLRATGIRSCDGVAIQEGVYPVKVSTGYGAPEQRSYRAMWVQGSGGEWLLSRLWLDPDSHARVGPVTGCRSLSGENRALHRWVVEAEVVHTGAPAGEGARAAMRDLGWTYTVSSPSVGTENFPTSSAGSIGFSADVTYRLTPALGVEGSFVQYPGVLTAGRLTTTPREPHLDESERWIAVLGSLSLGPARVAAGPALGMVGFDWTEGLKTAYTTSIDPVSEHQMRVGLMAQLSLVAPIDLSVQPEFFVRYTAAGNATAPAYTTMDPFGVSLNRLSIGAGMALFF